MEKWEKDLAIRQQLVGSFNETKTLVTSDDRLAGSVSRSKAMQDVIPSSEEFMAIPVPHRDGKVVVSRKKTLEAASAYKGRKIAVLHSGSAFCPGGTTVSIGGQSQEDSLCRETTLYPCISDNRCKELFYRPHVENWYDRVNNADMIYTPCVKVFKTDDEVPVIMQESDWFDVDVITMTPPDARNCPINDESMMLKVFEDRFTRILKVAFRHDAEVLILHAFGCGESDNDPALVAAGAARALEKYRTAFDTVEFAVYEPKGKKNYHMFRMVMDRYLNT